ncbi:Hsp70 family protein [Glycomyces buryatensis]|uniref:Hsp70 family protein n=1 Tax=Glycomyces buryatensis TaxID=2570927 RepID=A0A4S8QC49_9ACTN|nr:Hsp70 family protein [Glycomyces buryatensis]THV41860.1 hypothetical protein FAB82_09065 [Glycomyces buryatensis]
MNRPLDSAIDSANGSALGIDFGTSHTIAVVRRADGSVRPLLFDGSPLMPSAVCVDSGGGLLVGSDAVHAGRRHPERYEPNPKRHLDRRSILLGETEFPVVNLVGAVLRAVAVECRRVVGPPGEVTVTVPADWGPARRQAIIDASDIAGLGQVRLVPEPVAAATYYAEILKHRMSIGSSIVVYDLGAGTFDASVVRRSPSGFDTVALDGRNDLGGLDIDAALINHLGETYGAHEGWSRLVGPMTITERRHFREFQDEIRSAKERLSRHQQADIAIPILDVEAHLTRTELEKIAEPHLERTIQVTQGVIRSAGLDLAQSAGLFLVGGASRMPLVATMLHRALGVPATVLDQPEVVVAEGSVLWTAAAPSATLELGRSANPVPAAESAHRGESPLGTPVVYSPTSVGTPRQNPAPTETAQYRPAPPVQAPPTAQVPQQRPVPAHETEPTFQTARSEGVGSASTATTTRPPTTSPGRNLPPVADPAPPPPETPPRTEAERGRRKKISRRVVLTVIIVDILLIAVLVFIFGPDNEPGDGTEDDTGDSDGYIAGDMVSDIPAAHDAAIGAFASIETDAGTMLFSAGSDGMVNQWSLESEEQVDEFSFDVNVSGLWATTDNEGVPAIVAVNESYEVSMWDAESQVFTEYGQPAMAQSEEGIDRVSVGLNGGAPAVVTVNDSGYEIYDIEFEETWESGSFPEGYGRPNIAFIDDWATIAVIDGEGRIVHTYEGEADSESGLGPDDEYWTETDTVKGFGVVYDDGVPYGMLYSGMGTLHLWDLSVGQPSGHAPTSYDDISNRYVREVISYQGEPGLLWLTSESYAGAQLIGSVEPEDSILFGNGDITGLNSVTKEDGTVLAVTGTSEGDIQFWSLG